VRSLSCSSRARRRATPLWYAIGRTALHGARGDKHGNTAADIMARKRDPAFRKMAEQLRSARG
jgi:hypothetical protein